MVSLWILKIKIDYSYLLFKYQCTKNIVKIFIQIFHIAFTLLRGARQANIKQLLITVPAPNKCTLSYDNPKAAV